MVPVRTLLTLTLSLLHEAASTSLPIMVVASAGASSPSSTTSTSATLPCITVSSPLNTLLTTSVTNYIMGMARRLKQSANTSDEKYGNDGNNNNNNDNNDDMSHGGDELWQQLFLTSPSLLDRVMIQFNTLLAKKPSEWIVHGVLRIISCAAIRHLLPLSRPHITPVYNGIQNNATIASSMLLARLRSEYIFVFGDDTLTST
jgi:hypothetical protein